MKTLRALVPIGLGQLLAALLPMPAHAEPADWGAVGKETAAFLSGYLQVDTTNPPAGELAGAEFLKARLEQEGIEAQIDEFAPGRANLIGRLRGTGVLPPLCLVSHIDVVSAEAERWKHPPLSGHIDAEGVVWGRGALDMKGMGAVEFMAMVLLKREGLPLKRDIVLLAVADEEMDNAGILRAMEDWKNIGCSHAINEGGIGIRDMFFEGQTVYPISVAEKGYLWAKVVATGEPGHGSTPLPDQAPERLVLAWHALHDAKAKPVWDPVLFELLGSIGEHKGGAAGFVLKHPGLIRLLLKGKLMENPLTRAVLTDTLNITGFEGARATNVIPARVSANLDSRILPGTTPEAMEARIRELLSGLEGVSLEGVQATPAGVSPIDDPFYRALAIRVVEGQAGAVAGPALSPGFTDSIHLRRLGVRCYGLVPFEVSEELLRSMHGDNERIDTANLERGVRVLYRAILDVSQ